MLSTRLLPRRFLLSVPVGVARDDPLPAAVFGLNLLAVATLAPPLLPPGSPLPHAGTSTATVTTGILGANAELFPA